MPVFRFSERVSTKLIAKILNSPFLSYKGHPPEDGRRVANDCLYKNLIDRCYLFNSPSRVNDT